MAQSPCIKQYVLGLNPWKL